MNAPRGRFLSDARARHSHTYWSRSWSVYKLHEVTVVVSTAIELCSILYEIPEKAGLLDRVAFANDNYL